VTAPPASARDAAFDAVRGVLVLLMVVYHVLSIATTAGAEAFRYLRFLSGSFIFISGFVVVRFGWERFARAPGDASLRLVQRGLKVFLIFAALNLAISASGFGNAAKSQLDARGLVENAPAIFLHGDGRLSSFLILLPIAYLLMLAPLFLVLAQRSAALVCGGLLLVALALAAGLADPAPVAGFLLVGLSGLCLGAPVLALRPIGAAPAGLPKILAGLVLALWLAGRYGGPLVFYCIGVAAVVLLMAEALRALPGRWLDLAALVGRYSLLAYIAQILLIQCLLRALVGQRADPDARTFVLILGVAAATVALCVLTERLRSRSAVIDRTYRWVFA
jgi:peptidoglycan/LPS O-acetylase OafA/YrhL